MARSTEGTKPRVVCIVCGDEINNGKKFFVVKKNRLSGVSLGATCKGCLQMIPRGYRQTPNAGNVKDEKMVTVFMAMLTPDPHGKTWSFGDFEAAYVLTEEVVKMIIPKAIESMGMDRQT